MAMLVVWSVLGAVFGALLSDMQWQAMVAGALLGWLFGRQNRLAGEVDALRRQLKSRVASTSAMPPSPAALPANTAIRPSVQTLDLRANPPPPAPAAPIAFDEPPPIPPPAPVPRPTTPTPAQPDWADRLLQGAWRWLSQGNVPVKIGMLVLFAGVGALLKYASDAGLLHAPPALRLSMIALAAVAGWLFGWRQRTARRLFALSVQGGAMGVLVMTVFAAFRVYALLSSGTAFGLLLVLVIAVGVLSVVQDALALAVLGLLAGFAAPILVSTGQGSHVVLFSYYTLLNLAVLGIAWQRAWRLLNLLGFIATFAVATAWGVLRYEPALFASTEPFLVFNFLLYVLIPWLHLTREVHPGKRVVEASLVFGNPLVCLLLQGALLAWHGHALAWSAALAALIYLCAALWLPRQAPLRLLREAWQVLAVTLATLAVPLAFRADVTGGVFALEGAGLIWLGLRQQRALAIGGGIALQLAAGMALLLDQLTHPTVALWPVFNRACMGALLLVASSVLSADLLGRRADRPRWQALLAPMLFGWALLWWIGASAREVDAFVPWRWTFAVALVWLALSAWATAEMGRWPAVRPLQAMRVWSAVTGFALMLPLLLWAWCESWQVLGGWHLPAVLVAAGLGWRSLCCLRVSPLAGACAQWLWWWRWALLAASSVSVLLQSWLWLGASWSIAAALLPLWLLLAASLWRPGYLLAPLAIHASLWLPWLRYSLLAVLGVAACGLLCASGSVRPWPYLPLFNPLDAMLLLIAWAWSAWLYGDNAPANLRVQRALIVGGMLLALATSAVLRAVHQLFGVPWNDALLASSLAELSLTVCWSLFGLFAWIWGSRRQHRALWLAGAVLMAIVLLKLALVDRHNLGNLFGIASFIAFGVLCTVIGYLAPVPPRREAAPPAA